MSDSLVERVAERMWNEKYYGVSWRDAPPELDIFKAEYRSDAARAIALVVEECAKKCEGDFDSEMRSYGDYFATAIRSLAKESENE